IPEALLPAPAMPSLPGLAPEPVGPGVNLVGYLRSELGLGEAARQVVGAVRSLGLPLSTLTLPTVHARQEHPFEELRPEPGWANPYDINLVCVNAGAVMRFAGMAGRGFFSGRYTVGYWAWELEGFPDSWPRAFEAVDEIWMNSEHAATGVREVTEKPVAVFPVPVELPTPAPMTRSALGVPQGFLFLFVFDYGSVAERKNPVGLVQAFKKAFAPGEGPVLVIKSISEAANPTARERLHYEAGGRPDIVLLEGYMPRAHKDALLAACDAYVSLHRAEGFGITMAEAMALGKPTIATGYSGNLEFMTRENSYLVGWQPGRVPADCRPYRQGAVWAEPDLADAAALLRRVFENPEEAHRVGEVARADLARLHSPAARARLLGELLDRIRRERMPLEGLGRGQPPTSVALALTTRIEDPMPEDSEVPAGPAPRVGRGERPAGEAGPLRARLKETTVRLERVRGERDQYRSRAARLQTELQVLRATPPAAAIPPGKVLVDQESLEELRRAKRDLVRLLRRLGRPPLGWVLRRQSGYRR
ncbi:MAG: glycosyltransferase, partial [Geobacter sp.]